MARFDLSQYETVEARLVRFWEDNPDGRVQTQLVHADENRYIVRAELFKNIEDRNPVSSGYAEETVGSSPVNKTSALENCETSAIGRACANWRYQAKGAPRPSREEMAKASKPNQIGVFQKATIKEISESLGITGQNLAAYASMALDRTVKNFGDLTGADGDKIIDALLAEPVAETVVD